MADLLVATDLAVERGGRPLFAGVSMSLAAGDCVHICGDNGVGKTTLLRTLAGLTSLSHGTLSWRGQPLNQDYRAYWRELCYIGHAAALKDELTPCENLVDYGASATEASQWLTQAGLGRLAELPSKFLSQGQKRRILLCRLHMSPSKALWLLDEPLVALDAASAARLIERWRSHVAEGGAVVFTSHQPLPASSLKIRALRLAAAKPLSEVHG